MRRAALTLVVLLCLPAAAGAAPRSGTTSEGVRITVEGREVRFRVPRVIDRDLADITVTCSNGGRRITERRITGRPGRRVRVRMRRSVQRAAWCGFVGPLSPSLRHGTWAATLEPVRVAPAAAVPGGPGSREAVTTDDDAIAGDELAGADGDAHFILRDDTLTVRLAEPLVRSTAVVLACGAGDGDDLLGAGSLAIRGGTRSVSLRLGTAAAAADWCLIEDALAFGDIAVVAFGGPHPSRAPS